jgi:hypothetical protein
MAPMLDAQGMAVKDTSSGSVINRKETQTAKRQVDEANSCEDYRPDFDMYAVCKKREGYLRAEAATVVSRTDPRITILPALPCHRNATALTGSQDGTELPR